MASVVLGYLHNGFVRGEFMRSVMNLLAFDAQNSGHIIGQGGYLHLPSGPNLSGPRCDMVRSFLEVECEWLWILDSDMTFERDTLERLLACDSPIVGGLCFGRSVQDGKEVISPTLFDVNENGQAYRWLEYPPDSLVEVSATGTACLLIHRKVLVRMRRRYPEPLPWFAEEINSRGGVNGEDVTFCLRARSLGYPVKVHTGIKLGHIKATEINEKSFLEG